ncbi:AraC family two component transcriptional regulator [Natranaerovirga hydrolytica]|uniref:Stage 0 sporulation protein A homolog n=1 Tax=Natranaerovirga hydrolytica TaxID=680378 RepID=A0A4R1N1Q2_9FIRM|nr:response regulator [Natranaerovirga hydrolytica]TCL00069.1 AraC family two component transcriptional regulator [Natranaerovirga hydrolytica]
MYKLLIADDEKLEREALRLFIDQSSLEIDHIIECINGTETVKKTMLEKPDIILLDINMPGLNGLDALEKINMTQNNTKVIISSAFNYFEYALKAMQLGAIDFIVKPVKKEQLIGVLNKAIDQLDLEQAQKNEITKKEDMLAYAGKKIVEDLILGHINEEVLFYLDTMNIHSYSSGNCFFIRFKEDIKDIHKQKKMSAFLKKELELIGFSILANWKNSTLTLLVFNNNPTDPHIFKTMKDLIQAVLNQSNYDYTLGSGLPFDEISHIEESYNYARGTVGDIDLPKEKAITQQDVPLVIQNICDYIDKNYYKKINLDDIAGSVGFSKYYISRLFKQHMNITIIDFLTNKRIDMAKEFLKDGNYSIKQISSMVGYSDPNYLTWTFKKIVGVSPLNYRYNK